MKSSKSKSLDLDGSKALHIVSTIRIFERSEDDAQAYIVDEWQDLELIVIRQQLQDRTFKVSRKLRSEAKNKKAFDARAKQCKRINIYFDCTAKTVDLLTDETTPVSVLMAAHGTGKTHLTCQVALRQWLVRGNKGALFALVGASLRQSKNMMKKLVEGEEGIDPIAPPEIVHYYPRHQERDQWLEMVDGSKFLLLKGYKRDLEGFDFHWVGATEVALYTQPDVFPVMVNRFRKTNGQLFLESKPESHTSWLQRDVIQPCLDQAEEKKKNPSFVQTMKLHRLQREDNPWLNLQALEAADANITNETFRKRYLSGEMADFNSQFFIQYWNDNTRDKFIITEHFNTMADIGLIDITREISDELFGKPHEYIGGSDFNDNPMTTMVHSVGVRSKEDIDKPGKWVVVARDQIFTRGKTVKEHSSKVHAFRNGMYRDMGIVADASSMHKYKDAGVRKRHDALEFERLDFSVRGPIKVYGQKRKWVNGSRATSCNIWRDLMGAGNFMVAKHGCWGLLRSLDQAQDGGDGSYKHDAATIHDRLASPLDATRYAISAIFHKKFHIVQTNPDNEGSKRPIDDVFIIL